jgi:2-oxoglutarate ferredoxin oxidoreductase subunit alpha
MKRFSGDISLVLGGAAGQGVQTVEALLVAVLKREGYHVFASKEYMSRVRGGSNSTEIRITDTKRCASVHRIDILFALDGGVVPHIKHRIAKDTIVLGEKKHIEGAPGHPVDVPFVRMAGELGNPIFASTIAVGIALGILGADNAVLKAFLKERFAKKGDDVVAKNVEAAEKGYAFGKHLAYDESIEVKISRNASPEDLLIDGHVAVGLGAVAGGCNYISSYPMTPGTGVLNTLAQHGKKLGIVVDQAEDEIAAINHAIGAWYAGARAIVTTSGGGFDLMTEAVSLSGITETPIVTHIASRPGPSTGLPTRTEQGDLNLALYAGHGEFPRAIFAPGDAEEAFGMAQQAFHVADAYQVPVFILTDQDFLDRITAVPQEKLQMGEYENRLVETKPGYLRYALTESGVSPRGIPGYGTGLVGLDSDEHTEDAHITEDASVRITQHEKRMKKLGGIRAEALMPTSIGDVQHADTVVVAWGSNKGVLEEALEKLGREDVAGLHFSQVYPLPESAKKLFARKKVIVLENNFAGQFAELLKQEYGIKVAEKLLKYDGSPFFIEEAVERIKATL